MKRPLYAHRTTFRVEDDGTVVIEFSLNSGEIIAEAHHPNCEQILEQFRAAVNEAARINHLHDLIDEDATEH